MLHAERSTSCLLFCKRNLHPLAGTQVLSHILSAASLVVQTPSNIFWTFGKTSLCHFWGLLSHLPPVPGKLWAPLRHPWGWAFATGSATVPPHPPDISASHMLNCPSSNRHHFLLSNGHTGSLFDSSSFNTSLGSVQRAPAIKKNLEYETMHHMLLKNPPGLVGSVCFWPIKNHNALFASCNAFSIEP